MVRHGPCPLVWQVRKFYWLDIDTNQFDKTLLAGPAGVAVNHAVFLSKYRANRVANAPENSFLLRKGSP